MELPTSLDLTPIERLMKMEEQLACAKSTLIPIILPYLVRAVGSLFTSMSTSFLEIRLCKLDFQIFLALRKRLV